MSDPRDYKIDIASLTPTANPARVARPFLSVQFDCCKTYLRIYKNAAGNAYEGRCPRCLRPVSFAVGDGGTDCRSFIVR